MRAWSFRFRLAASLVAAVVIALTSLGVAAHVLVQRSLRDDLESQAERDARFIIERLAPARLPSPATLADFDRSGLQVDLERTADGWAVAAAGERASSFFAYPAAVACAARPRGERSARHGVGDASRR
jgi:hypothetical protein